MEPDLVVGIDVGMSGTGVAYRENGKGEVCTINWDPAQSAANPIEKVSTRLSYDARGPSPKLVGWGLEVPNKLADGDDAIQIEEFFKINLGKKDADQAHVSRLYKDFLTSLYKALRAYFTLKMPKMQWNAAVIQFVLSAPATWSTEVVDCFKAIVSDAGFGEHDGHSVSVGMTEPQATAAFQMCHKSPSSHLQTGQRVLVVDVGAGTGDFSLLKIKDGLRGEACATELQPRDGSANIDRGFQAVMLPKLKLIEHLLSRGADEVAWEMRCSKPFQDQKHQFSPHINRMACKIPIPHLKDPRTRSYDWIEEGAALVSSDKMQGLFDTQDCVLLSGGLGSSSYVQQKVAEFCTSGQHPFLNKAKMVVSLKPRLSVCMGLVYHARRNPAIFPGHLCRASFGVACRIPSRHPLKADSRWDGIRKLAKQEGRPETKDEFDRRWLDCIDWFIKKGERVPDSGVFTYHHSSVFHPGIPPSQRIREVKILTSFEDEPSPFDDQGETRTHVSMRVDLSRVGSGDVQNKNQEWYKKVIGKKEYVKVDYLIQAEVGLAEASFQCFDTKRTMKLSEMIRVDVKDLLPLSTGWVFELEDDS
ncbi:hypothetical protein ACJZ2D_009978 [Fusarium nematophilum]